MPGERLLVGTAVAIGLLMVALTPLVIDRAAKQRIATAEARTLGSLSTAALAADSPAATTASRVVGGANEPSVGGINEPDGESDDRRPVRVVGEVGTAEPSTTSPNPNASNPALASTNPTHGVLVGAAGQGGSVGGGTVTLASVGGDADVPVVPALTTVPPGGTTSAPSTGRNGSASAKPSGGTIPKPSAGSAVAGGGAGARATFASLDASQQQMIASRCIDVLMRPASYEPDLAVVCRSLAQMQR